MEEDSEYHTASEFVPDFESDNEPPVDKENEKKLFHKNNKLRIYKRILRVPKKSLDKPARFDRVDVRFIESDSEVLSVSPLSETEVLKWQLGFSDIPKYVEIAITSMKRGEVAVFENEKVVIDAESKERKLAGKDFFMIELLDFVTIIDIFNDRTVYKIQLEKGVGIDRLTSCDKVRMDTQLLNEHGETLWEKRDDGHLRELQDYINEMFAEIPIKNLAHFKTQTSEILMTMKDKEVSYIEFPDPTAVPVHDLSPAHQPLPPKKETNNVIEFAANRECTGTDIVKVRDIGVEGIKNRMYLFVRVLENARIDDVFSDNTVLKKTIKSGFSTAAPEQLSLIYFDFKIVVNEETIYSSELTSL